jgi:hypothetical protein
MEPSEKMHLGTELPKIDTSYTRFCKFPINNKYFLYLVAVVNVEKDITGPEIAHHELQE